MNQRWTNICLHTTPDQFRGSLSGNETDPAWLARPVVRHSLGALADTGLVYDLPVRPDELCAARDKVRAVPAGRFVLGHAGKPPIASGQIEPWRGALTSLARLPNVAVKLSGSVTEADPGDWNFEDLRPFAEATIDAFGPQRTMFGSDWPACLPAASYDQVAGVVEAATAALSEPEQAQGCGGTASEWYGLEFLR
ncbi:MAG: amidohydrolase family protein [Acidimicrobiales bacterium]